MAVNLSPVGGVAAQFFTSTGAVLTGGKLYTYAAGTTTPAVTYTSSNGATPWTNPVVLDAAGRVPGSGEIWLTDGVIYKFVLKNSNDVLIATYDNITGINSNAVAYTNQQEIVTATAGQTVFNLGISYQPGTNSLSVFVDGVNQYGPGAQYSYVETDSTTVTFNSGLHVGAEVKFTTTQQQGAGVADASQIAYDPPFTGSVPTNVEVKLAQTVSITDFGAVADGVTDNSDAINAALDYVGQNGGGAVYIPSGEFGIRNIFIKYSNVTMYGDGTSSWLKQIGSPYSNFAAPPSGSIFTSPASAITIAPSAFEWGDSQDPNTSTVGTVSSITLKDFRLTGWWSSAPPPYNGYNTNMTGEPYNDRSCGIISLCSAEIAYDNLTISQMGAENSYSWNAYISNCWIVNGGEVGSLGEYGNVVNCRVQNSYNENGVSARYITGNLIFAMAKSGILIGGSSIYAGGIVANNYVFDCGGYPIIATDDGAITVPKVNFIFENNVLIGNPSQSAGNAVLFIDYRAAGTTFQVNNNFITGIDGTVVTTGLYLGPCQGDAYISNNIIIGTGAGTSNGISTNATTGLNIYLEGNNITGVSNAIDPTIPVGLLAKGSNFIGGTVKNGANTIKAPTIDNLIVNKNLVYTTTADLVTSPTVTYSPVANQGMKQCQFTGASLTINPPSGYQAGQVFILEIFNASGGSATVTMSAGSPPAGYKGSMTSGVTLSNNERVVIQMVYITNTWLEISKAVE